MQNSEFTHKVGNALLLPMTLLMMATGHRTDLTRTPVQDSELRDLHQAKAHLETLREEGADDALIASAEAAILRLEDQVAGSTSRSRSLARH